MSGLLVSERVRSGREPKALGACQSAVRWIICALRHDVLFRSRPGIILEQQLFQWHEFVWFTIHVFHRYQLYKRRQQSQLEFRHRVVYSLGRGH